MKINFNYVAAVLVSASCVFSASAQTAPKPIGKMTDVQGLVTVTRGDQLVSAAKDAPFLVNDRIVTTSSGGITLDFDNGCDVTLKANQSIIVRDSRDCKALLALVTPVGGVVPVAAGGAAVATGSFIGIPLFVGGITAVAWVNRNRDVSELSRK